MRFRLRACRWSSARAAAMRRRAASRWRRSSRRTGSRPTNTCALKWSLDAGCGRRSDAGILHRRRSRRKWSRSYDPARARFRTYLRLCLDGFAGERAQGRAPAEARRRRDRWCRSISRPPKARSRSHEPAVDADVDELFYREWVRALLERSVADLKRHAAGVGPPGDVRGVRAIRPARRHRRRGRRTRRSRAALNLTPATVTNHLAAMRRQFRKIVLERLRELTSSEEEWEAEAARLLGPFDSRSGSPHRSLAQAGR